MVTHAPPAPAVRQRFRRKLLVWYRANGRDLPWRRTGDPYHILVSEVMLQQTQVDRVLPKYLEWLDRYPSLHALASAPEADVTVLNPDVSFRDQLDIDSMDFLNFVIMIHKTFGVEIPETDYPKYGTLNSCVEQLSGKRVS